MLQKDLTYGQVCLALNQYVISFLHNFTDPEYLFNVNDDLINTKFLSLLKKMPEVTSKPDRNKKFTVEYSNEPNETGHLKLFPSMTIGARSNHNLKRYELNVENQEGEKLLSIRSGGYTIDSWSIKEMLSVQKDEKIPSEPIKFDLPEGKRKFIHSIFCV